MRELTADQAGNDVEQLLEEVKQGPTAIVKDGNAIAVALSAEEYNRLLAEGQTRQDQRT